MADTTHDRTSNTARQEPQALRPPGVPAGGFPDRYRSLEFTTADEDSQVIAVTMQVQQNGVDLAGRFRIFVYLSETDLGAPDAANTTTAVTTGVELKEHTTDALIEAMTDENGTLVMAFTNSGNDDKYVYAAFGDDDIYNVGLIDFD